MIILLEGAIIQPPKSNVDDRAFFAKKVKHGKLQFQVLSSYLHPGLRTGMSGQSRANSGVLASYDHPTSYDVELRSCVMLGFRLCVCICICTVSGYLFLFVCASRCFCFWSSSHHHPSCK